MCVSKNKSFPLVSVIVRTKDRAELLREALESLATQSYPYIEAVVVNDGGVDVWPIVEEFADRLYRIRYIAHKKNRGRAATANTGLHAAEGEWVGLLDDDDLLLPKAVETLVWYGKAAGAVYGQVEVVRSEPDGRKEILAVQGQPFSRESLFICNYIPTCGLIFKRHLALKIGGFDEKFSLLEDWDFVYRLARETNFLFIPQKVALYRIFGQGYFADRNFRKEAPWRERFYRKHLPEVDPSFLSKGFFDFVENQEMALSVLQQGLLKHAKIEQAKLEQELKKQRQKQAKLKQELIKEQRKRKELEQELKRERRKRVNLEQELQSVFSSNSWRLTAPLRWLGAKARKIKASGADYALLARKFWSFAQTFGFREALKKSLKFIKRQGLSDAPRYRPLPPSEAKKSLASLSYKPLISVIVPVYNTPEPFLRACLESVFNQYYPYWELCIADDASTEPYVRSVLEEFRQQAPDKIKIIYRDTNGHISEASNSALSLATGEFVAFLDHDDELAPEALLEVAKLLNEHPEADMIYSDEDKISPSGEYTNPYFKPDWSPELFLGQMYTCHLGVYRRKIVEAIGGFRRGVEGAQDWDFVLRFTERTSKIFHIPKILYHWRMHPHSTAASSIAKNYATEAGKRVVEEALRRRGEKAYIEVIAPGRHLVHYLLKGSPLISIVIPTKDLADDLERCLQSIYQKTDYPNYEIVIVDNGSTEEETFLLFEKWSRILKNRFYVERLDIPFNFSRLVNFGVSKSRGEFLLLLNNDTELIGPTNWLSEMGGYVFRKEIACAGAVLLYPDDTIQHAGIILGITPALASPGVAGHAFKHLPKDHPGYFDRLRVVSNYAGVTGACLMVRRELWELVNGFDEELEVAFNDVDFCLKLLELGYRHVVLPHVRLYHHESKTRGYEDTPEKLARFRREIEIMRHRWAEILDNDPFYNPNLPRHREDFGLG